MGKCMRAHASRYEGTASLFPFPVQKKKTCIHTHEQPLTFTMSCLQIVGGRLLKNRDWVLWRGRGGSGLFRWDSLSSSPLSCSSFSSSSLFPSTFFCIFSSFFSSRSLIFSPFSVLSSLLSSPFISIAESTLYFA